jgi:hypothetical protein
VVELEGGNAERVDLIVVVETLFYFRCQLEQTLILLLLSELRRIDVLCSVCCHSVVAGRLPHSATVLSVLQVF